MKLSLMVAEFYETNQVLNGYSVTFSYWVESGRKEYSV
jgi:hypothetical protein